MELEVHIDRLLEVHEKMLGARDNSYDAASRNNGIFSHMHPERLKAEAQFARTIGRGFIELFRLTPHIREINQLRKDSKASSTNG